jgi:ABC-type polysaccharide/polyol phosphate transport system ATPase subunit
MRFNMAQEKVDNLKEYFIRLVRRQLRFEEFFALTDVSFTVTRGEVLGIVGLNGSGKSTILKIISGILKPTTGSVSAAGSISPLIELGAGFDTELTAKENVRLNAYTLGYDKAFVDRSYDEIVDFAELGDFMNVAIKNFSSGMVARLAFAVATVTKPDILIVDEVLSVGDHRFREKCETRIRGLMSGGTTVLLVSHSISQIRAMCGRVLWLDHGQVRRLGGTAAVCDAYEGVE